MTALTLQDLIDDLVARHGGLAAFNRAQIEIARAIVKLMVEMRSAPAGEVGKLATAMTRLLEQLPPPPVQPAVTKFAIGADTSVIEISSRYAAMVRGEESWRYSEEHEAARRALHAARQRDETDPEVWARDHMSESDFTQFLELLNEIRISPAPAPAYGLVIDGIATPASQHPAGASFAEPPHPAAPAREAAPAPLGAADELRQAAPDARGVAPYRPPPVDPRLKVFTYFHAPAEQRAEIERGPS
jgi:hypothetical protein